MTWMSLGWLTFGLKAETNKPEAFSSPLRNSTLPPVSHSIGGYYRQRKDRRPGHRNLRTAYVVDGNNLRGQASSLNPQLAGVVTRGRTK